LNGKPVLGAPGCARSPAENGFDWVLQQVLAGFSPDTIDIAGMGVGGLLMETGMRPHPRLGKDKQKGGKTAAIILAAGQSRRMGDANKMSVEIGGKAMVRHVAEAAVASGVSQTLVVTGHEPDVVHEALSGLDVGFVHSPRFNEGLSQSLAAGISALDDKITGAVILLGDMPFITSGMINEMLEAGGTSRSIVMATHNGKRGNPVLWPSRFFQALTQIEGDTGARHVIGMHSHEVVEVELGEAAALDLDTPEAVAAVLQWR
ncbi:MAG: NTP transferase domain-containing protein, partial [Pseudomonadota bacterium]